MKIKSIRNIKNLKNKKILLRVDYNLPFNSKNNLDFKNSERIKLTLPTIKFLQKAGATIIIASHLGRPREKEKKYSLDCVAKYLSRLLRTKVIFLRDDILKTDIDKKIKKGIYLLENIRFYKEESVGEARFAKRLASMADIFVNEAFSVCHRSDASVSLVQRYIPTFAGFRLEEEVLNISKVLPSKIKKNQRPYLAIVGGAKISTKINLLKTFECYADEILLGGSLISEVLKYRGCAVGKSILGDVDKKILKKISNSKKVKLPVDVVVATDDGKVRVVNVSKNISLCNYDESIFDIGPKTILEWSKKIKIAKTIIWNGPLGYFEEKKYSAGTLSLGRAIAVRGKGKAYTLVGGGETISALKQTKMAHYVDWISTGGGAMLAYLGGERMPGFNKIIKI